MSKFHMVLKWLFFGYFGYFLVLFIIIILLFHSVNATRGRGEMLLFEKISNNQYKEKDSI